MHVNDDDDDDDDDNDDGNDDDDDVIGCIVSKSLNYLLHDVHIIRPSSFTLLACLRAKVLNGLPRSSSQLPVPLRP
jgi:hypothetical protein